MRLNYYKGLGITEDQPLKLSELVEADKVKECCLQALFGKPDVLLLDEPATVLDAKINCMVEEFLISFDNTVIVVSADRHLLKQSMYMADVDFIKIKLFVGKTMISGYIASQWLRNCRRPNERRKNQRVAEIYRSFLCQRF